MTRLVLLALFTAIITIRSASVSLLVSLFSECVIKCALASREGEDLVPSELSQKKTAVPSWMGEEGSGSV